MKEGKFNFILSQPKVGASKRVAKDAKET